MKNINVIARAYTMTLLSYMNMLMYNQMENGDDLTEMNLNWSWDINTICVHFAFCNDPLLCIFGQQKLFSLRCHKCFIKL
jgi:hypothetical protein